MRSREQPLIAILMEEGPDLMVGILAVLKAGCGFVPIRPSQPDARISYILSDCGIRILLTDQAHLERARRFVDGTSPLEHVVAIDAPTALLEAQAAPVAPAPADERQQGVVPRDPDLTCYVAYTSGSTGHPKGVVVSHRNVMALMLWSRSYLALGAHTRTAQNLSFAFDFGIYELFTTILFGGSLHFFDGDRALDIDGFVRFLDTSQCNTLHTSVSYFRLMLSCGRRLDMLGAIHLGAESLPKELVIEARSALAPECAVFHGYGPTEATINCTMVEVRPAWLAHWERCRFVPIGWVSARNRIYILDRDLNPLPVGVAGELYVGGDGVALGYRDPVATAERFVPDPFAIEPGQRMYATGDIARWLPDGNIEYLGRRDDQIKIRGFRIELGEIEAALRRHPGMRQVAVVVHEDAPDRKRLVACCAISGATSAVELRAFLKEQVPDYMVPASFVVLDRLPLNANGKIDRARLPALVRPDAARDGEAGEPMSVTESRIARLWADALGLGRVGRHDNFFALGGDSIQCIQIAARAREHGLELQPSDLFRYPTVAELAGAIAARPAGEAAIGPVAEQGRLTGAVPLGPIQRWFFDEDFEDRNHWNQAICLNAPPSLAPERIEQALAILIDHHDMLRARFWRDGAGWQQEIVAHVRVPQIASHDLSRLAPAAQDDELARRCAALQPSLDIEAGALVQGALFDLGSERGKRLVLIIHHLVIDGVSWRILVEDLARLHQQLEAGQPPALPAKTLSYRQWLDGLRSRAELADGAAPSARDIAATALPRDFASETNLEGTVSEIAQALSREDHHALLHELPRSHGLQAQELLLAALVEALCAWSGQPHISLMLEQHGREALFAGADARRTVGWFTSLLPVTLAAALEHPETALRHAREALAQAQRRAIQHGMARLRQLAAPAGRDQDRGADRAIEVAFNYLGRLDVGTPTGAFALAGEPTGAMRGARNHRRFVLEIDAAVVREQLEVRWRYSESLHRRETIEALSRRFATSLQRLVAHCRSAAADASLLARRTEALLPAELRARLEQRWGAIEDVHPLTPMQAGMLFHSELDPGAGVYVEQLHAELDGPLDVARFTEAWVHLVARHPILRTVCVTDGLAQPLQAVLARIALPIEHLDWRDRSASEQARAFAAYLQRDLERGLPPTQPPLFRLCLIQRAPSSWYFLFSHHHLLLDGWSLGLLFQDLFRIHEDPERHRPPARAARAGFGDYISWLHGQAPEHARQFWQSELHGVQAAAPLRLEQPPAGTHAAEPSLRTSLPPTTAAGLRSLARAHQLTLSTVLHAAAALLLARYTGRRDVVLGTVSSGRTAPIPDCESIIGLLINTVPVRLPVDLRAPLAAWLRQIDDRMVRVRAYEHTPLRHIRSWCGLSAEAALFDVLLVIENYPLESALRTGMGGLRFASVGLRERTNYPITLSVTPGAHLDIGLQYDPSRITGRAAERMLAHFCRVLEQLADVEDEHVTVARLSLLSGAERDSVVRAPNATAMPEPVPGLVHRGFERQVERTPDAIAVVAGDAALTYAELNQRSNRLAHHLRRCGVGPDARVGLLFDRSLELVIAMLGVLKAGGAYVPLDRGQPHLRLQRMASAAGVRLVLCAADGESLAAGLPVETLSLDRAQAVLADAPASDPESDVAADHLAYVLYTSGSTGEPKGAMISHRALANHMAWMLRAFPLEATDRWLQKTPIGFDASVLEFFAPLLAGAQLVMAGPEAHRDVQDLCQALLQHRITHLQVVPSLLLALLEEPRFGQCRSLRRLFSGGEALTVTMRDRFVALHPGAALINLYGPTEATIDACSHVCRPDDAVTSTVPIGRPVDNLRAYVLDQDLEPVPVGIVGELHLGGLGLARGYLGRPDLTAEAFIPDHVSGIAGARLYRTGDLAMWSHDGALIYHGRIDGQVKLGGARVELAEIEAVLEAHPAVRRAAVVVHERAADRKRLLAFVMAGAAIAADDLRAHLSARLPMAMIPSSIVFRADLPLTASGKLDRRALARLAAEAAQEPRRHAAPTSEQEAAVAEIWRQILAVDQVGVHDSFFDLGGDSLAAMRVVSRIRDRFEVELTLQDFFTTRTVAELAARLPEWRARARMRAAVPLRAQQPAGAVVDVDQLSDAEVELLLRSMEQGPRGE
jgi:amino acid adenylation domain-containing protein/non-ribosomal peptide synthase protein (TIGR01720 family)